MAFLNERFPFVAFAAKVPAFTRELLLARLMLVPALTPSVPAVIVPPVCVTAPVTACSRTVFPVPTSMLCARVRFPVCVFTSTSPVRVIPAVFTMPTVNPVAST